MHHLYELNPQEYRIMETNNLTFQPHLHQDVEIFYVLEGQVHVTIEGHESMLTAGQVAVIFPNIVHQYETKQAENSKAWLLVISLQETGEAMSLLHRHRPISPIMNVKDLEEEFHRLFQRMIEEKERLSDNLLRAYYQLVLQILLHHLKLEERQPNYEGEGIKIILQYLGEHFQEPIQLEKMAKDIGMGRTLISNTMNQATGGSIRDYINNLRIDMAKYLLRKTSRPIIEIAIECGYDQVRTFNRVFKELVGQAPSHYRRNTP